ncbi:ABC transporter ATP-binding protein [Wolbachia endosymbiont of Pentidionis agamae]|uniref:ABC transporter ATP-binding protein n=1 Tax=Wolbachia endosymbiont of Pentidionis agamae TaxID=3110435 RepID=UPI002FD71FD2
MLKLEDVFYFYHNNTSFALNKINIKVENGNITCLLGHSGCGKSTILKLISGIEKVKSGSIIINDRLVASDNKHVPIEKRNVGLIFQHPSLFPHKTVVENVMFAIKTFPKNLRHKVALDILDTLNIKMYENFYPSALSGGQQQLVSIARVVAQNPTVVLLDEPFSHLDIILKSQIRKYILSLFKEKNIPVLMVTHDPEEALEVADFLYVMRDGKIIQSGHPNDVYIKPKDHILAKFFNKDNYFHATVRHSYIESPFGKIPARQFQNNDNVIVLIRPEAILLNNHSNIEAVIEDIKLFNNVTCINVQKKLYLMRLPDILSCSKGDVIYISLDFNQVLMFKN